MLKLDDIVALAKQGYKVSDVKELIELSKEAEAADSGDSSNKENKTISDYTKEENPKSNKEDVNKIIEDEPEKEAEAEDEPEKEAEAEEVIDYKKKVEELEDKIKLLQKANTERKIADTDDKSDSDILAEAVKSFM